MNAGRPACPLVVMAKAPEPGTVKTRLARAIGAEAATAVARASLADVWRGVHAVPGVAPALVLSGDPAHLPPLTPSPTVVEQGGGDLGQRMERHLRRAIDRAGRALMVGSDSPGVPAAFIEHALDLLDTHDAVLGPALDGGFWLIGLRRLPAGLLDDLPWSDPTTLSATVERFRQRGLTTALLAPWFDVDRIEDLGRLRVLLRHGVGEAPAMAELLDGLEIPDDLDESPRGPRVRRGISVVIPTLNEAKRLPRRLLELAMTPGIDEVIVADGASTDGTDDIARAFPQVRCVQAPRGRASQMNAGAALAGGTTLLFVHADVRLPPDATEHIATALASPRVIGGAFRTHHVADGGRYKLGPLLRAADLRSRVSRVPYGDQAIFVRTADFHALGGYPDIPLMEDVEFSRRLRRRGKLVIVPAEVEVSGRRFETRPIYYTTLVNVFPLLYRLGTPPEILARLYKNTR
ncbi:MAG: TIGR04283 family arsenosugar biosynthesis glycosyltransferase [Myxococcota bacterium]